MPTVIVSSPRPVRNALDPKPRCDPGFDDEPTFSGARPARAGDDPSREVVSETSLGVDRVAVMVRRVYGLMNSHATSPERQTYPAATIKTQAIMNQWSSQPHRNERVRQARSPKKAPPTSVESCSMSGLQTCMRAKGMIWSQMASVPYLRPRAHMSQPRKKNSQANTSMPVSMIRRHIGRPSMVPV